jgi:hypothetical protein
VVSIRTSLLAFACVWAAASTAAAQAAAPAPTPESVRRDAQIHVGPFYLTPRFAVKEFGVDSNVFNNAQESRDFTFTIAPRGTAWVPFGRRALMTTGVGADVVYYQRYSSERSINPDVRLRTDLYLGRITPFVEAGYLRTRQRLNFEIDARSLRQERPLRAGVSVRLFSKIGLEASSDYRPITYGASAVFNEVSLRETMNRTTLAHAVTARYDATPLTTFSLKTETATDRFEFAPERDADSVRIMQGVELKPRALISGSAHIGVRRFSPHNPALEGFKGLVASASLNYVFRGSMRATVTAERDIKFSYEPFQPYFVLSGYGVTVRRQIVGSFDLAIGFDRQTHSYRNLLLPGGTEADLNRVDITRTWTSSVGYRVGRTMRASVGSMYRGRESNSARFRDYEGVRLITSIDYEF